MAVLQDVCVRKSIKVTEEQRQGSDTETAGVKAISDKLTPNNIASTCTISIVGY